MRLGNRELRVTLIVATAFVGCADGSAQEPLGEVSLDWGNEACSTAVANQFRSVRIDPILSPQSYTTCKKSYVVDLASYGLGLGGFPGTPDAGSGVGGAGAFGGTPPLGEPNLTVRWGDSLPITQAECEASWVGGIFYRGEFNSGIGGSLAGVTWSESTGQRIRNGVWSAGECHFPPVVYEPLATGEAYRVAATARDSLDQTRKVSIRTGDPDVP